MTEALSSEIAAVEAITTGVDGDEVAATDILTEAPADTETVAQHGTNHDASDADGEYSSSDGELTDDDTDSDDDEDYVILTDEDSEGSDDGVFVFEL